MSNEGKLVGIDFGEKRIGLAISDETRTFARELTIVSPAELIPKLEELIQTEEILALVLGYPLSMSGTETEKTKEVLSFKEKLENKLKLEVHLFDERLSSVMTDSLPGGDINKDSLAAQIILQNYLDTNKNK